MANSTKISNTSIIESGDQGFQGFIRQDLMTATTTTGTPAAGTFYSSISNRASIQDLSKNLKVQMGVERIKILGVFQLQNEFGANGEPVWTTLNDDRGLLRFVGTWSQTIDTNGANVFTNNSTDYIEITFYGTGLNVNSISDGAARSMLVSVDGGSASTITNAASGIINGRNYSSNAVIPLVSGLAIGTHTIKVAPVSVNIQVYGFEILNESTTLKVSQGTSYLSGKKSVLSSLQSPAYNSTFETGTLGTRGGRVLVYQKSDGTIGKAVQPTDSSQGNLTGATHANEEVIRTYHWREFGAGRTSPQDDFSLLIGNGNYAFTLDDGTTTLVGNQVNVSAEILYLNSNGAFVTITFIGTGLDIVEKDIGSGSTDTFTYAIDGSSASLPFTFNSAQYVRKIVSGLPYGTHTVKITRTSATSASIGIKQFIVYGPKKPALPSGAIELADYNLMADYIANNTSSIDAIGTGVLRKSPVREMVYVDGTGGTASWSISTLTPASIPGGFETFTDRSGTTYFEYTFFGTGFDLRGSAGTNRSSNITCQLQSLSTNGSLLTYNTTNFSINGTGPTTYGSTIMGTYGFTGYNAPSGFLNQSAGSNFLGAGFTVSGLSLGLWKVRFTNTVASSFLVLESFDIVTPIHSPKSNLYADLQNTLAVGSCGISDNRQFTPIKNALPATKAWAQAVGVSLNPTTAVAAFIPCPDLSITVKTTTGRLDISWSLNISTAPANSQVGAQIFVDGVGLGQAASRWFITPTTGETCFSDTFGVTVSPGVHKIDLYWYAGGTTTANANRRQLTVKEL